MALLDRVIHEVEARFGLGRQSSAFIAETIRYMQNGKHGGLEGFLAKFRNAGLEDVVSSWLAKGQENLPITGEQLERAIGNGLVTHLGSLLSLAGSTVRTALVFAIPKLVDLLTPDGVVVDTVPADIQAFLNSPPARFRPAPAATPRGTARDRAAIGPWGWAAALLWSGLLAYWTFTGSDQPSAPPETAAISPRASLPARLALSNNDGKVEFSGIVGDETTRARVIDQLRAVFGAPNVAGQLAVDSRVGPAPWLAQLAELLRKFNIPGADLLLEGNGIKVGGWLSDAERASLVNTLKSLAGDRYAFDYLGDKTADAVRSAQARTLAALDSLQPGATAADVMNALNLWVINFATDSADLPPDGQIIVSRAAKAINAAPDAVVIEIDGHTDDTGDPAANQTLSEARARSVVAALVAAGVAPEKLRATGHGSTRPVVSNGTAGGRFRNRRIEFRASQ